MLILSKAVTSLQAPELVFNPLALGHEPIKCPECGTSMLILEVYKKPHYSYAIKRLWGMDSSI